MADSLIMASNEGAGVLPRPRVIVDGALAASRVLLVGAEAAALQAEAGAAVPVVTAESLLEAVLVSGQGSGCDLIIAGIGREIPHLQRGIQSLRMVNPEARIVLLAEPCDEPQARRALAWGADDYQILPVTLAALLAPPEPRASAPRPMAARVDTTARRTAPAVLQLPLMVEAALMEALLQGRADIAPRGAAILQSYLPWPGTLRVQTPAESAEAKEANKTRTLAAPLVHGGVTLGELVLEARPGTTVDATAEAARLGQAAAWLAGWMAMQRRQEQLRSLAITDELSGAYNRRYFQKFVAGLLDKARLERFRVTLLLFDIDNFKTYNDRFGHAAGDAIIRQLIGLLRRCTRSHDLVARIGGDEFAVVFWDAEAPRQPNSEHPRDAMAATERFRKAIAAHNWAENCRIQGEVSISGGIASFPWDADTFDELLATADAALLRAKAQGKNVIVLHEEKNGKEKAEKAEKTKDAKGKGDGQGA